MQDFKDIEASMWLQCSGGCGGYLAGFISKIIEILKGHGLNALCGYP